MIYTLGSIFSGIGGFELGFEATGKFKTKWQIEIDANCRKVLGKHWPHTRKYNDVTKTKWDELERVDGIIGGPPCQPTSVAGKQRGESDERWLWPQFIDAIRILRPCFAIAENPPGILQLNRGRAFGRILGTLAACGYELEWQIVSAQAVGAWHKRERLFLVAYLNGTRQRQPERLFEESRERSYNGLADVANDNGEKLTTVERGFVFNAAPRNCGFWRDALSPPALRGSGLSAEFCEWFMGFPAGWSEGLEIRNSDRVKAFGNTVVPQVAEYVATETAKFLDCMYNQ